MSENHWVYGASPSELYERFWREYEAEGWESSTREWIDSNLGPGDLFVDIGAWIGPVTLWALRRGANVIAVEPDPVALEELKRRVPDEVEIWAGAVGVSSGESALTSNFGLGFGKSVTRLSSEGELPARTWTLAEILAGRIPDLVKIDIEGYESELLPEVAPLLARAGVPMQVELHGQLPERSWFEGYSEVQLPDGLDGPLRAWP